MLSFQVKEHERRWAHTERSLFEIVEKNIEAAFRFVADPSLSIKNNASNYLKTMHLWLYFQRPVELYMVGEDGGEDGGEGGFCVRVADSREHRVW
jgi:hypothetical protein